MSINCALNSPFKPRVYVRDLSQTTQRVLRLHCTADGVAADRYNPQDYEKFDQLATLKVKHGVRLDMASTSKLCFSSAVGVLDFLRTDFTKTNGEDFLNQQMFLKGQSCPSKE
ncbi:MAG: hypothetical protein AAB323_02180 [Pseudomonadota bacterium]